MITANASKQLKLGAIISYAAIILNIIYGLFYTPWMIKTIGHDNYGLYTLAMSVIGLFLFDFGLSSAITRFITKYLAEDQPDKADKCLGLVYRLYIGLDVLLLIVLSLVFFYIPQIYHELTSEEIERFRVLYAIAATYSVLTFPFIPINGILVAHEKFIPLKICEIIHKIIIVASMSVCLLLGYKLYALILVNAFAGLIMTLSKLWCVKKYTSQRIDWHYWNKSELKDLAGYSGWVTLVSLAQRCIFNIAPTILGVLSGSSAIAILGIAITIEGYTYTFASALNGMFLPRVSRIVAHESNLLPLMIKVGRIQILVISLLIGGFICLGKEFIALWVGEEFSSSYICALLIISPSFLQLPQEIGMQAIIARNKVKQQAIVFTVMALLNIIGAILLVPRFGAVGICISICFAYIFRTIGIDVILVRFLHIDIKHFIHESFFKILPSNILSLVMGIIISKMITLTGWIGFLCSGVCFVFSYFIIMYIFAMNQYEKDLFLTPFKKLFR